MTIDQHFTQPEIRRDRYGRYLLPHPTTGREQTWQRVTTFNKLLADTYNLEQWRLRKASTGLAQRPDLLALIAAVTDPDSRDGKQTIKKAVDDAIETAGASTAANIGTAIHALTEQADAGQPVQTHDPHLTNIVTHYQATLRLHQLTVDPALIERVIVNTRYDVAGTCDRYLRYPDGSHVVADIKTGSSVNFGQIEMAQQLAAYATADGMWNGTDYDPMPTGLHLDHGYIIHLPAAASVPECTLWRVDLTAGRTACDIAAQVRDIRKTKPMQVRDIHTGDPRLELLRRCRTMPRDRQEVLKASWPTGIPPLTDTGHTPETLDRITQLVDSIDQPAAGDDTVQAIVERLQQLPTDLRQRVEDAAKTQHIPHHTVGWTTREAQILNGLIALETNNNNQQPESNQ